MSEAVKDLIQQAMDQDFSNANKTFQDVMTIKMSDLLDQEKVRLADQIYNGVEPEDEDDLDLEDDIDAEELEDEDVQESDPDAEESMGDEGSDGSEDEEDENDEDSEES